MSEHFEHDEFTPEQAKIKAKAWIGQADSTWKKELQESMILYAAPIDGAPNYENDSMFNSTLEAVVFSLIKDDPNAVNQIQFTQSVKEEALKYASKPELAAYATTVMPR